MEVGMDNEQPDLSDDLEEIPEEAQINVWNVWDLRRVRYEPAHSVVLARSFGWFQRILPFPQEEESGYRLRFTTGFECPDPLASLLWVKAYNYERQMAYIAVDPAFVYSKSGCLVQPSTLQWAQEAEVPFLEFISAAVYEFSCHWEFSVEELLLEPPQNVQSTHFISLDYEGETRLHVFAAPEVLTQLEISQKNYSQHHLSRIESIASRIAYGMRVFLRTVKPRWTEPEIAALCEGDLLALQNFNSEQGCQIRGYIRFLTETFKKRKYEVFLNMNNDDTRLHMGAEDFSASKAETDKQETQVAPHELIDFEIYAGTTKLYLDELSAVQEGTLIELREHSLPLVTLNVMGTPILEGELVVFQNQIFVQVTRRLG
ncbi:MAG: hypothetical protein HC848_00835 [Limnobacter sp.]|nr:hypothetical protein [Limnobacter sp.]